MKFAKYQTFKGYSLIDRIRKQRVTESERSCSRGASALLYLPNGNSRGGNSFPVQLSDQRVRRYSSWSLS